MDAQKDRFKNDGKTITILCGEDLSKPVIIEDACWNIPYIFQRDGDFWCWVNTSKPIDLEKRKYERHGVFVNLNTGEKKVIDHTLIDFRSTTTFSPNGKLVIIDAGIIASSGCKTMVIDLTDWDNVTVIYCEEIWDYIEYSAKFDEDSNVVFTYVFELFAFDDKVALNQQGSIWDEDFIDYFYENTTENVSGNHSLGKETLLINGGECTTITHTVVRKYDKSLVTRDSARKWSFDEKRYKKDYENYMGMCVMVNEMAVVSTKSVKGIPKKRNNVQIDETNFHKYLK